MNKKLIMISSSIIGLSLLITGCESNENSNNESNYKQEQKEIKVISDEKFKKLPYNEYYKKSDLKYDVDAGTWGFKNDKLRERAENNVLTLGSNYKFGKNKIDENDTGYYNNGGNYQNPNYNIVEGDQFKSAAIDLKVNNSQIYYYNEIANNQFSKDLPFNATNDLGSLTVSAKHDSQGVEKVLDQDNNAGIVKIDVTIKNNSPKDMGLNSLLTLTSNKMNQAEPLVGRITIDKTTYSENQNIDSNLNQSLKPNQELNATIYYVVNDDVKKHSLDLISTYQLGYPLSEKNYVIKTGLK